MKIVRNLRALQQQAQWAIKRSTRALSDTSSPQFAAPSEEKFTFSVVNLLNSWANFQRTYFICCLLGVKSASSKSIISNQSGSVTTSNDAIGKAILHFTPARVPRSTGIWDTRDEPTWHDSNTLIRLSTAFAFSNDEDIQTAFTFGFTAHKNLVTFRNYYAHKNQGTKKKAQAIANQYLIPQHLHPTAVLLETPSTVTSTNLLEMWTAEFNQTIELLCG